jgi:hypothetical protein
MEEARFSCFREAEVLRSVSKYLPAACLALAALATPAAAQIFWSPPDLSGPPLMGPEPGYGVAMPGATAAEQKAALVWNMRSGLNVAALQCAFEPLLRTESHYNAMLSNHRDELAAAFTTLSSYFKRTNKTPKAAQGAIDTYGTRTYSSFSAVSGQLTFCTAAGRIGRAALGTPRGSLATLAQEQLRSLYNGVKGKQGEQQFRMARLDFRRPLPSLEARCWKGNKYIKGCGMVY